MYLLTFIGGFLCGIAFIMTAFVIASKEAKK